MEMKMNYVGDRTELPDNLNEYDKKIILEWAEQ